MKRRNGSGRRIGFQDQAAVVEFLSRPDAYEPPPERVERIDTHASIVFLAGERAYKIKRAVTYPFLDFSTLEKRRRACLNELNVNARTAPEIYEAVVAVTRDSTGRVALDGDGEPVEWAVRMHRFDQSALYDRMADEGRLDIAEMAPLADAIRAFHARADRVLNLDWSRAGLTRLIAENDAAMREHPGVYEPAVARELTLASRRRLDGLSDLLRARARQGHVRHCHGDLHLRNIVHVDGRPILFDAVEFDDAIATVDTLHDLAFLLMDLWARGLHAHANAILNKYLAGGDTGDLAGLGVLPLFLSTRAMIRSKAEALRVDQVTNESERAASIERAGAYFALAQDFLKDAEPILVAIGGLSGTGKTTVARGLAPRLGPAPGAVLLRSDMERKRLFGAPETEKLPAAAYRPAVTATVYHALRKKAGLAAGAGHSVIVDAVHGRPEERMGIEQVARARAVPFIGLWLTAPESVLIERVAARSGDASDADAAVVRAQLGWDSGVVDWHRVDADRDPSEIVSDCAGLLVRARQAC